MSGRVRGFKGEGRVLERAGYKTREGKSHLRKGEAVAWDRSREEKQVTQDRSRQTVAGRNTHGTQEGQEQGGLIA